LEQNRTGRNYSKNSKKKIVMSKIHKKKNQNGLHKTGILTGTELQDQDKQGKTPIH
jgi:hypothetical protein